MGWVRDAELPDSPYHELAGKYLPMGAGADMIRLSVGLEDLDNIIWDLDQALTVATEETP